MDLNKLRELLIRNRRRIVLAATAATVLTALLLVIGKAAKEGPPSPEEIRAEEAAFLPSWSTTPETAAGEDLRILSSATRGFTYRADPSGATYPEEEVFKIARVFGFKDTEMRSRVELSKGFLYSFAAGDSSLSIYTDPLSVHFNASPETMGDIPSEEALLREGEKLLKALGAPNLAELPGSYQFLKMGGETTKAPSPLSADAASLNFALFTDGLPIVGDGPSRYGAQIILGKSEKLVAFKYEAFPFSLTREAPAAILPPEEVRAELERGRGRVVYIEPISGGAEAREIFSLELSQFSPDHGFLAYYLSEEKKLTPIYVLGGNAQLSGGGEVSATVYLLAK